MDGWARRRRRLLVTVGLALVSGVSVGGVGCGRLVGIERGVQIRKAAADLVTFESALERFKLDLGRYPTTEEGLAALVTMPADQEPAGTWKGPYVKSIPRDPWGTAYVYRCPGEHHASAFDVMSCGRDRQEGTEDDVKNWKDQE